MSISNWASFNHYQQNGCQELRRGSNTTKCGRVDGGSCVVCGINYCQQHAIYVQIRVLQGAPIRRHVCVECSNKYERGEIENPYTLALQSCIDEAKESQPEK